MNLIDKIKIPKGQILKESLYDANIILKQIVTCNENCSKWYLYNVELDGKLIKIETGSNPLFTNSIL